MIKDKKDITNSSKDKEKNNTKVQSKKNDENYEEEKIGLPNIDFKKLMGCGG